MRPPAPCWTRLTLEAGRRCCVTHASRSPWRSQSRWRDAFDRTGGRAEQMEGVRQQAIGRGCRALFCDGSSRPEMSEGVVRPCARLIAAQPTRGPPFRKVAARANRSSDSLRGRQCPRDQTCGARETPSRGAQRHQPSPSLSYRPHSAGAPDRSADIPLRPAPRCPGWQSGPGCIRAYSSPEPYCGARSRSPSAGTSASMQHDPQSTTWPNASLLPTRTTTAGESAEGLADPKRKGALTGPSSAPHPLAASCGFCQHDPHALTNPSSQATSSG